MYCYHLAYSDSKGGIKMVIEGLMNVFGDPLVILFIAIIDNIII